ncbi:leucyl aminopeptidase [Protofrankia symbiont of Coriaria ruscifolia]|uniref:leucyl aminopeptidase n=1 Tax=Protofrankia symbiont of Coriaria ruscifolia TaxID=1306542 RepID=UPI001F5E843E|nr:leucyl aminopeptidase [Protofrankia symbiont of Coriaria ruscifolia]
MPNVPVNNSWVALHSPAVRLWAGTPLDAGVPVLALLTLTPGEASASAVVTPAGRKVGESLGIDLDLLLAGERASGDQAEVIAVPLGRADGPRKLLLVGAGKRDAAAWRAAGAAFARRAAPVAQAAVLADAHAGVDAAAVRAFAEGLALASYRPSAASGYPTTSAAAAGTTQGGPGHAGSNSAGSNAAGEAGVEVDAAADEPSKTLREVTLIVADPDDADLQASLAAADATARAVHLARDLVNMPSLVKSPAWFADRAVDLAQAAGLGVQVLGSDELAEEGFGGLVAVGRGSSRPPRLVRLTYHGPSAAGSQPRTPDARHVVLVGKGITFDSGGLSLKPATSMATMKTDMSGAAAILATMVTLPVLKVPGRVTALLCLAENMIGGGALRPGDVISCWGGTTVEVLNTDAEGRLVLADGLAYAATLAPDAIVDLATLTGAITIALGRRTAGLFASDDVLADQLSSAAGDAGERVWRLPLVEDYRPALESTVADLANTGTALSVSGGSITAALFLREFTGGVPWAHLDIAGTARSDGDEGEVSKGGTGWGVRTLLTWLAS